MIWRSRRLIRAARSPPRLLLNFSIMLKISIRKSACQEGIFGRVQVVAGLKIHPEFRRRAKVARQS